MNHLSTIESMIRELGPEETLKLFSEACRNINKQEKEIPYEGSCVNGSMNWEPIASIVDDAREQVNDYLNS